MRVMMILTAAAFSLGLGATTVSAQVAAAPVVAVSAANIEAILGACAAGNCADAVAAFVESAKAAGATGGALDDLIVSVAGALVDAAKDNPALAAQIAEGLNAAAANASPALAAALADVASAVASGNAGSVDLNTLAEAAAQAPAAGTDGSPS